MACCIFTALIMNGIIKACDKFDIEFLKIQYHDADEDKPDFGHEDSIDRKETSGLGQISVHGMTCNACVAHIEEELRREEGVFRVDVSLVLGRAIVSYDPSQTTPARLLNAVESAGYKGDWGASAPQDVFKHLQMSEELRGLRNAISSASIGSFLILLLERASSAFWTDNHTAKAIRTAVHFAVIALSLKIQIFDAWSIHSRAWALMKRFSSAMETLLSLSLLSSVLLSLLVYVREGAMSSDHSYAVSGSFLAIVILAGKYLEMLLRKEANSTLVALFDIQSQKRAYTLERSNVILPATLLKKGDRVILIPGATVPCDCYIATGNSLIDEATITGESRPVKKEVGDFLFSGTRNLARRLTVIVALDHSESSLSQIIDTISTSTAQRTETSKPLEIIVSRFVSGVLILSFVTGVSAFCRTSATSYTHAFVVACEKAMTVLAAACPCGIGLAVPSAALAGIDAAHCRGILLGGGIKTMETVARVTDVVMDKTGTLTSGHLQVVGHYFKPTLDFPHNLCYDLLASSELEYARVHPVAKAIFKWAFQNTQSTQSSPYPATLPKSRNLSESLGTGVQCEVEITSDRWVAVHIGTQEFLLEQNIILPTATEYVEKMNTVFFAFNHRYSGHIIIQDSLRRETQGVIDALRQRGLQISISTGDTALEAERISKSLDISTFASRASPADKNHQVISLQRKGHCVMMVGDGLNDAHAQATADVGVSFSVTPGPLSGAADISIISGDLRSLLHVLNISKHVMSQARWNVRWAIVYNVVALSCSIGLFERWGIIVTAPIAATMMSFSSISTLSMSLFLRSRLSALYIKR